MLCLSMRTGEFNTKSQRYEGRTGFHRRSQRDAEILMAAFSLLPLLPPVQIPSSLCLRVFVVNQNLQIAIRVTADERLSLRRTSTVVLCSITAKRTRSDCQEQVHVDEPDRNLAPDREVPRPARPR